MTWGKLRPDRDSAHIAMLASCGCQLSNFGYANDLQYYQGTESIYKAQELARHMDKAHGDELVRLVSESNTRMEAAEK